MKQLTKQLFLLFFCVTVWASGSLPAHALTWSDLNGALGHLSQLLGSLNTRQPANVIAAATTTSDGIVRTSEELLAALIAAKGGEVIKLAPGEYTFNLWSGRYPQMKYPSEVTITSVDPDNRAVITAANVSNVYNVTFENLLFDYRFKPEDQTFTTYMRVTGDSRNITFRNNIFDGDVARGTGDATRDGYANATGIMFDGRGGPITNLRVEGNEVRNFIRGFTFGSVDGATIIDNEIYDIRSDGLNFASVKNVVIEGNYFRDFRGSPTSGDHMDMIQFWTNGTTERSENITIRGNILMAKEGSPTQSIFMRNEEVDSGRQGEEMYYRNFVVEDNVIFNGHAHGITIGEVDGITIRNNTLLHNRDASDQGQVSIPKISVNQNARNVLVTKNILPEGIWNYSDATQAGFSDNYYVQNTVPEKDNFYGKLFINALAYEDADLEDIVAIPGSIIDTGNYGSSKTQPSASTASIVNTSGTGLQLLTHTFSVPGANSVRWEFGDGGTASGNPVTYTYKEPGTYEVEARVEIDGQRKTVKKSIEVLSPVVLDVSFENGSADDKSYLDSDAKLVGSVRVTGGVAVYTGTESNYIQYPRAFARSQNTAFTVSLDVTPTAPFTQGGTILYHSGSYQLGIEPTALSVYLMFPDLPKAVSRSVKYNFVAGQTYRLTYVFEGQTKTFRVFVNGTKVDEFTIEASRHAGSLGHDFLFGNPWRASFPRTIDNLLMLRGALTDAEVATYASTGRLPVFGASVAAPVTPVPTPTPTPTPTEPMQPVDEDFLDPPPTPVEEVEQPEEEVLPPPAPITPITPVTPVTPTPGRIRTTDMLNVRTVPGGSIITMVPMGSQGTVLSAQPIQQGTWSWIQVRFDSGVTGYVATAYTVPLTSENSPSGASAADIRAVQLQQIQQLLQLVLQLQRQLEQLRAQGR